MRTLVLALSVASFTATQGVVLSAQNSSGDNMSQCPMMEPSKDSRHAAMAMHGDQTMGFAHDKTTHHFLLAGRGGLIEVKRMIPATLPALTRSARTWRTSQRCSGVAISRRRCLFTARYRQA